MVNSKTNDPMKVSEPNKIKKLESFDVLSKGYLDNKNTQLIEVQIFIFLNIFFYF
jgi:hypothetical protein